MEQYVTVYPKTDKESWGDAHDKGSPEKTTCTPKWKCWHGCDHIVNIVQNFQNSTNDENTAQ